MSQRWTTQPDARRTFVASLAGQLRGRHLILVDLAGIVLAGYAALAMGFDALIGLDEIARFSLILSGVIFVRTITNVALGLYSRDWRFASVPDLVRIVGAALLGSLLSLILVGAVAVVIGPGQLAGFPRSFWILELLLSVGATGGIRFAIRAASEWRPRSMSVAFPERRPTLLFGAGRTGVLMARSALRNPDAGVVPVGFLDDNVSLKGQLVEGLRVLGGLESLDNAAGFSGA